MQISPGAALLSAFSSMPAQSAASGVAPPAQPPAAGPPPALAAAAKALAERDVAAVAVAQAAVLPPLGETPPKNLPRGSIVNLVV